MGYKVLGFVVWQGGKWYLRRRAREAQGKIVLATAGLTIVGLAVAAQRQRSGS